MQIQPFPKWAAQTQVQTDPGPRGKWAGIAIAPGSDEGLVLVDDLLLPAGRIHPFVNGRYTVKRVRPNGAQLGDQSLDCIATLSLMLFEHPSELGAEVARPAQRYSVHNQTRAGLTLYLSAPFVGRRQAKIFISSPDLGAGVFGYKVKGVSYHDGARIVKRYTGPTNAAATLDENGTLALYVGGEDNAEEWDALEVYINRIGTGAHFDVDVDTIGELGAR